MDKTSTFASRLRAAMKAAGMDPVDVQQLCGMSKRTLQRRLSEIEAPRVVQQLACFAQITGADLVTLVLGDWKLPRSRKYSNRRRHFWHRVRAKLPVRVRPT